MKSEVFLMDCYAKMCETPDNYYDLVSADPPYFKGVGKLGYFGEKQSALGVKRGAYEIPDWDNNIPDEKWLKEAKRISKDQIIWGINYFPWFHTAGRIVWDKVNGESSFSDCEIASCTYHDSVRLFRYMWNGMCQAAGLHAPTTMQGNKKLNEKRIHPTQKPVPLYYWMFKKYLTPGAKIFEPYVGSGSARIAADMCGFDFTGCETNVSYFNSQEERFQNHIAQLKMF
jgi:site-specific DNA-methyltransferase (adenine-specific)